MKKQGSIVSLVLLIMVFSISCQKAKYENLLEGKVKKEQLCIAPKVAGRIVKVFVKESDVVKAGDTLAIIDVPEIEAKVLQAEGAYLSAKAQYQMALNGATSYDREQISAKVDAAKEQYAYAEKSFKRFQELANDSLLAWQKYDEIYEKYKAAQAYLNVANSQKNDVDHGVRKEKVLMAQGDMKKAEGALKETKAAYAERYIIAPQDMIIESVALKQGELLLAGYTFISGYKVNEIYFRFTVSESKISKYSVGSACNVKVAVTGKTIPGRIVAIKQLSSYADKTSSYANYELGETVYELKVLPKDENDMKRLFANMTVLMD